MAKPTHKIQRILLELTTSNEQTYKNDEQEFSDLVNGSFSVVMDELLTEADEAGKTLRIPKLELDLGEISRPLNKEGIVSLFREKLKQQVNLELERANKNKPETEDGSETEALLYFLKTGNLPWWASPLDGFDFGKEPLRTALKNFLLTKAGVTELQRLVNQFTFTELEPLLRELVAPASKTNYETLSHLVGKLMTSGKQEKQKTARGLLQSLLQNMIESNGNIKPLDELLSKFISQDQYLGKLTLEETLNYFDAPELTSLEKLIALKKNQENEEASQQLVGTDLTAGPSDNEEIIRQYLSSGSFRIHNHDLSKREFDFVLTESIRKYPAKVRRLLKDDLAKHSLFMEAVAALPDYQLRTLLEDSSAKKIEPEILRQLNNYQREKTVLSAAFILNSVLKKTGTSTKELARQVQPLLNVSEKEHLKTILSEEEQEEIEETDSTTQFTGKPDQVYFEDLLAYVFIHREWPWWGNFYLQRFTQEDTDSSFENRLTQLILDFENAHPNYFPEAIKNILNTVQRPDLFLRTLSWNLAKKITDRVFPAFKNSLGDTAEALITFIAANKPAGGLQPAIIAQQWLLAIINRPAQKRNNFRELVNELITQVAVKLKMPLWEVYRMLLKEHASLALKNSLTREDAASLFVYHESLEDQYAAQLNQSTELKKQFSSAKIAAVDMVSVQHEEVLHRYINGDDAVLDAFPSVWALGEFIVERIRHSEKLRTAFKNALQSNDFRLGYRVVELERLSGAQWLSGLLGEEEDGELKKELSALLPGVGTALATESFVRSFLISQRQWKNAVFSEEKRGQFLEAVSSVSGIRRQKLEKLSAEQQQITRPEKNFSSHLKVLELKKHADKIVVLVKELNDVSRIAELLLALKNTKQKNNLATWISNLAEYPAKKELTDLVRSTSQEASLSGEFIRQMETVLRATFDHLIEEQNGPQHIQLLMQEVMALTDLEIKNEITAFSNANRQATKAKFIQFVQTLPDFTGKTSILQSINDSFPGKENVTQYNKTLVDLKQNKLDEARKKSGLPKELVAEILEDSVEEDPAKNALPLHPLLKSESIADIALYYFFNGQLPWWSPVKDTEAFEKLLQDVSWSSQLLLRRVFSSAAEDEPGVFKQIADKLSESNNDQGVLNKEETELLLSEEISHLRGIFQENEWSKIEELIAVLLPEIRLAQAGKMDLPVVFRKFFLQILLVTEPEKFAKLQQEAGTQTELSLKWKQLAHTFSSSQKTVSSEQEHYSPLFKSLEEKYQLPERNGISLADTLFLLAKHAQGHSEVQLLDTWFAMLEQFVPEAEWLRIREEMAELEPFKHLREEKQDAEKMPVNLPLPYTNYFTALALAFNAAGGLSSQQKKTAMELAAGVLQLEEVHGNTRFASAIVFSYLKSQNTELSSVADAVALILSQKNSSPSLSEILQNLIRVINGEREENKYALAGEQTGNQPAQVPFNPLQFADNIIRQLRARMPLLEKLSLDVLKPETLENETLKKMQKKATAPGKPVHIDPEGRIYVPNAGLVILWPFLSRLFANLEYTDKGQFVNPEKQLRAIHLSQYLVSFTEDHPEYTLLLNKILCGMEVSEPIERTVHLTEEEKTEGKNLLSAVLMQWKEMSNTSPENFQRTFMQREGVLHQKDGNWYLKVEHTPFDILLLKLPWGLSMIKYAWNNYLIFVEWKAMN